MTRNNTTLGRVGLLAYASVCLLILSTAASASPLSFLGAPETVWWSDMALTSTTVSYDAGTDALSITNGSEFTAIEIGAEYGPTGHTDFHYGTNGTLGGNGGNSPVQVSLNLNATVDGSGAVSPGGTIAVTHINPPETLFPGNILDDYGLTGVPQTMLSGSVVAVELGATGTGSLDVLVEYTGGFLQTGTNSEPSLAGIPYATNGYGLLRISAGTPGLPADWSASFSSSDANTDVFGVPEPASLGLIVIGSLVLVVRKR